MSSRPVFQKIMAATNTFRQHRKPIIKRIQKKLKAKVITYVASPYHPIPAMMIQDIPFVEEMLRTASRADEGYMVLNSPGGDANTAEKILMMCRQRFQKNFNIIVPDYAKSAATMLALGSDKILMGYLAELGPIDPQLRTSPIPGPGIPARSLIDGLELIRNKVKIQKDPVQMYFPMLNRIRPEILVSAQNAIDASRGFARKWLMKYMLKTDPKQAKKVAKWLSEGKRYKSHGKVIDFAEAHDVLKLNVERIDPNSKLWTDVWELYCRSIFFLQGNQAQGAAKLFESDSISLMLNLQIRISRPPTSGPPPPTLVRRPTPRPAPSQQPQPQPTTSPQPQQPRSR
jgi:ClpP class serine protease